MFWEGAGVCRGDGPAPCPPMTAVSPPQPRPGWDVCAPGCPARTTLTARGPGGGRRSRSGWRWPRGPGGRAAPAGSPPAPAGSAPPPAPAPPCTPAPAPPSSSSSCLGTSSMNGTLQLQQGGKAAVLPERVQNRAAPRARRARSPWGRLARREAELCHTSGECDRQNLHGSLAPGGAQGRHTAQISTARCCCAGAPPDAVPPLGIEPGARQPSSSCRPPALNRHQVTPLPAHCTLH